jgi:hypothetical protein
VPVAVAEWIVTLASAYLVFGLLFAAPFLIWGVARVDSHAASSGVAVRLVLLPGTLAFWPLLLSRWARGVPPPIERTAHRQRAAGGRSV